MPTASLFHRLKVSYKVTDLKLFIFFFLPSVFVTICVMVVICTGSFNNVKSEIHVPMCYQCLWYGVMLKPKKIALQNDQEVPQKVKTVE